MAIFTNSISVGFNFTLLFTAPINEKLLKPKYFKAMNKIRKVAVPHSMPKTVNK